MCNTLKPGIAAIARSLAIGAVAVCVLSAPVHAYDRGGWRGGGGGWGWGVGVGLATGLAVDAALGWPGYYPRYPYAPYYPYAVPVAPPVTIIQQAPAPVAPPVAAMPAAAPTAGQYWYYCTNPKGYYPYVPSCQNAWQPVPAVPPGAIQGSTR